MFTFIYENFIIGIKLVIINCFYPGNIGVNELLTSLIQAVDVFSEQQRQEIKEEEERTAREMIKIEQDQAYQASLEIDRLVTISSFL